MAEKKKREEGIVKRNWDVAKEKTQKFVEDNPWKSAVIAGIAGAVTAIGISALFGRKKKSWWENFRDRF